jgi:hypothetical protein
MRPDRGARMRGAAGRQETESRPCRTSAHQAASAHPGCIRKETAQLFRIWSKPCGMYASVGGSRSLDGRSSRTSLSTALTTRRTKKNQHHQQRQPNHYEDRLPDNPYYLVHDSSIKREGGQACFPSRWPPSRLRLDQTSPSDQPTQSLRVLVLVVELAVARLHVPPGPCEPRCYGRIAVVPVSLADSVPGLMRPGCLNPHGDGCRG